MSQSLQDILRKKREQDERQDRPKVEWFSLAKKNPIRVKFLQELHEDAPNYDSSRGSALFLVEHVSPHNFRRRAECTFDTEGRCYACEMDKTQPFLTEKDKDGNPVLDKEGKAVRRNHPWGQKNNMYVWVMTEDEKAQVLSRPAPGNFFDQLYVFAEEENEGSITDVTFRISKGTAKSDKWELRDTKNGFEVNEIPELVNLADAVSIKVPYEKQQEFYGVDETPEVTENNRSAASGFTKADDVDW